MSDDIKKGDWVSVYFEHVEIEPDVLVVSLPYNAGESWRLKRIDGTIVYVQNFSKMIKHKEKNDDSAS